MRTFDGRREHGDGAVNSVVAVLAPVEHKFKTLVVGANTINEIDLKFAGTSEMKLWVHAKDVAYAGGETLTLKLYRNAMFVGETAITTPSAVAGNASPVSVSVTDMEYCNKAVITGTVTVASGSTVEVFLGKLGQV